MVDWGRGSNYTGKARKEKIKERKWNQKKRERKREGGGTEVLWGGEKQGGGGVNVKCRREERKREGSGATLGKRKGSRSIQFGVSVPGTDAHCWLMPLLDGRRSPARFQHL